MENGNRWWEFYLVRYAMGTLVGAVFAYFLAREMNISSANLSEMSFYEAAALLSVGLTFCYVASGPILVFHAGRFLLRNNTYKCLPSIPNIALLVMVLACLAGAGLMYCGFSSSWFVSAIIIFIAQAVVALVCLWNANTIVDQYLTLACSRAKSSSSDGKQRKPGEEFIESYRHLGEHGNSFFILFLEIVVALAILDVLQGGSFTAYAFMIDVEGLSDNILFLLICLAAWTLPSITVWSVAKQMEYNLVIKKTG